MRSAFNLLGALGFAAAFSLSGSMAAANECSNGLCGTPEQSGGGCGCGCGCSVLVAMTDRGETYQFADDFDGDGIEDQFDNCPFLSNYDQVNGDGDVAGDACDLCAGFDEVQSDLDGDGMGDNCDADLDGDGRDNATDVCANIPNAFQTDTDLDGMGDVCDANDDNDEWDDVDDDCRLQAGPTGDACDDDRDGDGIFGSDDNCPDIANAPTGPGGQADTNHDGIGDLCDFDADGDGVANFLDNCPSLQNPGQIDLDGDRLGDGGLWGAGPESCDQHECYMIPNSSRCLDPNGAFTIALHAPGLPTEGKFNLGDTITVAMLTNRLQETHSWTARFTKLPDDSEVSFINGKGAATTLGRSPQVAMCQRADADGNCVELNNIRFTPDVAGDYEIKVTADLPRGDPKGLGSSSSQGTLLISVADVNAAGGCSAAGDPSALMAVLGALGLMIRRRR